MSSIRIVGIVIAAVGVLLLIFGYNASQSVGDQVTEALTGEFTDETMWYLAIGVAALVGGGLLALFGKR